MRNVTIDRRSILMRWTLPILVLVTGTPASAQDGRPGQVASSTVGRVGQRSSAAQAAMGTAPLERLDSRIRNRVQSRIRNRIDPSYDPQANAAAPFAIADDQIRAAGDRRRR